VARSQALFQQVDRAYKILSHREKRQLYDSYGEHMVEIYENEMLSDTQRKLLLLIINPKLTGLVCVVFLALFALFALVPIFLTLRLDGTIEWSWSVVLLPMWVLDLLAVALVSLLTYLVVQAARALKDATPDEEQPILSPNGASATGGASSGSSPSSASSSPVNTDDEGIIEVEQEAMGEHSGSYDHATATATAAAAAPASAAAAAAAAAASGSSPSSTTDHATIDMDTATAATSATDSTSAQPTTPLPSSSSSNEMPNTTDANRLGLRDWAALFMPLVAVVLFVVFQTLLCVRLDSNGRYLTSWWWVFWPLFAIELYHGAFSVDISQRSYRAFVHESHSSTFGLGYVGFLFRSYVCGLLRVVFWVLVVLDLDGSLGTNMSAWLLFTPLFVLAAYSIVGSVADWRVRIGGATERGESDEDVGVARIASCVALTILLVSLAFFITFVCLTAAKIDGDSFSFSIVFIPAFVLLGLLFCVCFCCCIPLLYCMQRSSGGWSSEAVASSTSGAGASPGYSPQQLLRIKHQ